MNAQIQKRQKRCEESGQALILSIVALVVLLVASLLIFDLQSIIRGKIKTQSASDSAALAACEWQVNTLNLLGELNIVKACTVLVSDIAPFGDDSPEGLQESADILTEMQARIAFVGPVIGFGAAQQAAKNNGISVNGYYTNVVNRHTERLRTDLSTDNPGDPMDDYYQDEYYFDIPKRIGGYQWRRPYLEMLVAANSGQAGIAAAPNVEYAGLPLVDPPWLMDLSLYFAISSEYWCHPTLRYLLKSFDFNGKWWDVNIVSDSGTFPYESEYFPVLVDFSSAGDQDTLETARPFIEDLADDRGLTLSDEYDRGDPEDTDGINSPLPYVSWCVYESSWSDPASSPDPIWLDDEYLRSGLRQEYAYGGAVCKMTVEKDPAVISSAYTVRKNYEGDFITREGGLEAVIPVGGDDSGLRKKYLETSTSTSLAKPLGFLESSGTRYPPYTSGMVLPVFDKARLIPIAMQDPGDLYDPFNEMSEELYQFLQWLSDVDDIDNPGSLPPGALGPWFLSCLQKLNSETWRSRGYNRNYVYQPPGYTQPYDPGTGQGAGWLQMGYRYQYDVNDNPIAIIETNEDSCDDWPGPGPGDRHGPPILH